MPRVTGRPWRFDVLAAIGDATTDQQRTHLPSELSNSPCLHLTAESDSAEFTLAPRWIECPVPPCQYGRFEYGGVPVNLASPRAGRGAPRGTSAQFLITGFARRWRTRTGQLRPRFQQIRAGSSPSFHSSHRSRRPAAGADRTDLDHHPPAAGELPQNGAGAFVGVSVGVVEHHHSWVQHSPGRSATPSSGRPLGASPHGGDATINASSCTTPPG